MHTNRSQIYLMYHMTLHLHSQNINTLNIMYTILMSESAYVRNMLNNLFIFTNISKKLILRASFNLNWGVVILLEE